MKTIFIFISFVFVNTSIFGQNAQFSNSENGVLAGKDNLTTGINNQDVSMVNIYSDNNDIFIVTKNLANVSGQIVVYSIEGKAIYRSDLNNSDYNRISFNNKPGIYVVKVRINNEDYTQKLYLK